MSDTQPTTMGAAVSAAKSRALKVPIEILVQRPVGKPLILKGKPQQRLQLERLTIETIGDMSQLTRDIGKGVYFPVPDLSIQVLNIVLDLLGLIEPAAQAQADEEPAGANDVESGKPTETPEVGEQQEGDAGGD